MRSLLPAILALAALDSINPASITTSIYLAGTGHPARLRMFIAGVYCTYFSIGLGLVLGPGLAVRPALAHMPSVIGAAVEVAVGGLLVAAGIRTWRRRASPPVEPSPGAGARSGLALGFLATLADLPTAGPLLVATTLLSAVTVSARTQVVVLAVYNVVYICPLLAIAVGSARSRHDGSLTTRRRRRRLNAVPAVTALCVACGALLGIEGLAALV